VRWFLDRLYTASGALAAICIFLICATMLAQALGREVGVLVRGADDIVAWLCAARRSSRSAIPSATASWCASGCGSTCSRRARAASPSWQRSA
jgi:hypothetical protein